MWEAVILVVVVVAATTIGTCLTLSWSSRSTKALADAMAQVMVQVSRELIFPASSPESPTLGSVEPESLMYEQEDLTDPAQELPAWAVGLSQEEYDEMMRTGIDPISGRAMF